MYQAGQSLEAVASHVGVGRNTVKRWLAHIGVELRSRNALQTGRPRRGRGDYTSLACSKWVQRAEDERLRRGWTRGRVEGLAHVHWEYALSRDRPRPQSVIRWADALDIPRLEALRLSGWKAPSPLAWEVINALLKGAKLEDIAARSELAPSTVGQILHDPERAVPDETLNKLGKGLGLSPRRVRELRACTPGLEVDRSTPMADDEDRAVEIVRSGGSIAAAARELGIPRTTVWNRVVTKRRVRSRARGGRKRTDVDLARLDGLFADGLTIPQVAATLGVPKSIVADRARERGWRRGETWAARERREARQRRTAAAREAREDGSVTRRQAAEEDARLLGPLVHDVDAETFAAAHRIRRAQALEILRKARERSPR